MPLKRAIKLSSEILDFIENDFNSENSINSVIDRISKECSVKKLVSIDKYHIKRL